MNTEKLLEVIHIAEKLKDTTRHCYTSKGRHESVAEHSWRISLMAYWIADEFPEADMNKVIKMCLIHDLGECFTGDIPTFMKTSEDETKEKEVLYSWVNTFPEPYNKEMLSLYKEMAERKTLEAKIFKAMDSLEALIQHNESDIRTWSENEFDLNLTYANDKVSFSTYLKELRQLIYKETISKMEEGI